MRPSVVSSVKNSQVHGNHGDGSDQELLESERFSASDAFVALTDRDEDNLIISLYAMQQGIPKVVAKANRQNYAGIARAIGLESVISPKAITAAQILHRPRDAELSRQRDEFTPPHR